MNARTEIGEQMSTIVGVIGGGQLARMMIPAAVNLGVDIRVLAEADGMSAELAAASVGDYRDLATVLAFAETVDVVTFDHEHVPQAVLKELMARGIAVHPGPDALLYAQDKLLMRERLAELGLPVPDWARVTDADELDVFLAELSRQQPQLHAGIARMVARGLSPFEQFVVKIHHIQRIGSPAFVTETIQHTP